MPQLPTDDVDPRASPVDWVTHRPTSNDVPQQMQVFAGDGPDKIVEVWILVIELIPMCGTVIFEDYQ